MIRRLGAVGALGLATVAPLAACGPERLSSLPIQAPSRAVTATPSRAATATPSGEPVFPPARGRPAPPPPRPVDPPVVESTPPPSATPSCPDAYDFDPADDQPDPPGSICIQAGGVLRLRGVEAGAVTAEPAESVDRNWEAGVQDLTFRAPGTVTVTFPRNGEMDTITVEVTA